MEYIKNNSGLNNIKLLEKEEELDEQYQIDLKKLNYLKKISSFSNIEEVTKKESKSRVKFANENKNESPLHLFIDEEQDLDKLNINGKDCNIN